MHKSIKEFVDEVRDDFINRWQVDKRVIKATRLTNISTSHQFKIIGLEVGNGYNEFELDLEQETADLDTYVETWVDDTYTEAQFACPKTGRRLALKKLLHSAITVECLIPMKGDEVFEMDSKGIDLQNPNVRFGIKIHRRNDENLQEMDCGSNDLVIESLGNKETQDLIMEIRNNIPVENWGTCFLDVNDNSIRFIKRRGNYESGAVAMLSNIAPMTLSVELNLAIIDSIKNSKVVQDLMKELNS